MDFTHNTDAIREQIIKDRRYLHQNAECGFDTKKTTRYICNRLKQMGLSAKIIGKGGIVADIGPSNEDATLLRADIDALPMKEKTGLIFSSRNGNMHACGHDMHVAMLLGAAEIIKSHEKELSGRVRLFFQPAEEILRGAKDAMEHRILSRVKAAYTIHVLPYLDVGTGAIIIPDAGVGAPGAKYYRITLTGRSAHSGAPQNGTDTIVPSAHLITAIDSLFAKEIAPTEVAVNVIGRVMGGVAPNAVCSECVLEGSYRAFNNDTLEKLKKRLSELSLYISKAFRCKVKFEITAECPPLLNDESLSYNTHALLKSVMGNVFSPRELIDKGGTKALGGSEDFAYISEAVPSLMIGIVAGVKRGIPLHHPQITFDENVLTRGASLYAALALGKTEKKQ